MYHRPDDPQWDIIKPFIGKLVKVIIPPVAGLFTHVPAYVMGANQSARTVDLLVYVSGGQQYMQVSFEQMIGGYPLEM